MELREVKENWLGEIKPLISENFPTTIEYKDFKQVEWLISELTKSNKQATDTIKLLYKEMKKMKSDSVHFTMNQIFHDEKASAVISVLDKKKPPHMVLSELSEWAEDNGDHALLKKIELLEKDLSFLDEE